MKQQFIELNGLANIHMQIQQLRESCASHAKQFDNIDEQLDYLERYMLASFDAVQNGQQVPMWYEIYNNPSKFPTLREKLKAG